jgi:hypothetical protein
MKWDGLLLGKSATPIRNCWWYPVYQELVSLLQSWGYGWCFATILVDIQR